jgi:diaminohydroxyphosphoribosylaminopyrimidine deaminase/5-amino-6-(5-phosphoribosylamino)uracil reductase
LFVTRRPWRTEDRLESRDPHMRRALELARRALGRSSPNPGVGAVIVRDGQVVGEGWTAPAGGPHAEQVALRQAGPAARGATIYVTLEPCCHHGRTPPCTDALIRAGIRRVEIGTPDPNPRVAGAGAAALRDAGIEVHVGLGAHAARALIAPFRRWVLRGRPLVMAKYAMTLDGRIASRSGDSRWVSGPDARRLVHQWRDVSDAILVGAGTVLADDPRLGTRLPEGEDPHQPLRVVLDSRGRTPLTANVFDPAQGGPTVVASVRPDEGWADALGRRGVDTWRLPGDGEGRVDLPALLDRLAGERGVTSLLVEGGSAVLGAFLGQGLVDRLAAFVAPKLVGGSRAPGPVGDPGRDSMALAHALRSPRWASIGQDLLVWGEL